MYLQNKYTTWYYNIINNAKSRTLSPDVYTEKHHIIPRSMGGDNCADNLVKLTAREHFVCHLLLVKMVPSSFIHKMQSAITRFMQATSYQKRFFTSWEYKKIREYYVKSKIGRSRSQETKIKISEKLKGRKISDEQKIKMKGRFSGEKNPNYGKILSSVTREKISKSNKNKKHTKETIERIRKSSIGRKLSDEARQKIRNSKIITEQGENNKNAKTYKIISPDGTIYIIKGKLVIFCKEHNLWRDAITAMAKNKINNYKGWTAQYWNM
jgi:NUMOD3 motif